MGKAGKLLLICFVGIVLYLLYIGDSYIPFSPMQWQQADRGAFLLANFSTRRRLIRRLERQYPINSVNGMSKAELTQLLGEPDFTDYGRINYSPQTYPVLIYYTHNGFYLYSEVVIFKVQKGKIIGYDYAMRD